MSEASFASLNPALLARKGGAKPAMRPQLTPLPEDPIAKAALGEDQLEDLGWNDMGSENDANGAAAPDADNDSADVVSITSQIADADLPDVASPVVLRQQKDLSNRVLQGAAMGKSNSSDDDTDTATEPYEDIVRKAKAAKRAKKTSKKSSKSGKRAAFTLRLDTDRHLKLRLASTMQGVSAQALVTQALDQLLEDFDDLDALAERMKRN